MRMQNEENGSARAGGNSLQGVIASRADGEESPAKERFSSFGGGFFAALRRLRMTLADVLVPQLRPLGDERLHQRDAARVLNDVELDAAGAEELLLAEEGAVLADDHARDAVEEDRAAAHRAGGERRVEDALAVDGGGVAAGALERVHLAVQDGAAALHA